MRSVKLVSATIAALLLAAPALAEDKVVNVYTWSDYIDPSVLDDFTKETGIKVVYDTMDSNETLETKLLAGSSGYDVVVPSAQFLQRQVAAGLYLPLDKSKIPNLKFAWDKIAKGLEIYDPGNQYAVNYMWGTTGIGYNLDKAKAILGTDKIDSWDVIFKPEILAKFKDCGVYVLDSATDLIPSALNYLHLNPDSKNPDDLQKATDLMTSIRPYIRKFDSSDYINALANGDICLAVGWSGDVLTAKGRAVDAHTKSPDKPLVNIDYVIPKEGAELWFDSMSIPKDAPHPEEALAYINFITRPDIAARNTNFVSYANGSDPSQQKIDDSIRGNKAVYPDDMSKLFLVTSNDAKTQKVLTRDWTKIETGE